LLGFPASECLVIEDAPAGIQSAQAGGMKVVGLASTYSPSHLTDADAVAEKLARIHVSFNGARKMAVTITG
jgi:mannitol-1-/sugar-/sorbitol-6-phosphatase